MGIAISHYRFRKAFIRQGNHLSQLPFIAKGYPYSILCALTLCLIIIGGQNYNAFMDNHVDWYGIIFSYIGLPAFLLLWLGYKFVKRTKMIDLMECNFEQTHPQ